MSESARNPKSEGRNPHLAEPEPNEAGKNRGIRGRRGRKAGPFPPSAYSAYSAVPQLHPFCVRFGKDEAKAEIAKLSGIGLALNTEATLASVSRGDRTEHATERGLRISDFGFPSDFGASDFGFRPSAVGFPSDFGPSDFGFRPSAAFPR